MPVVSSVTFCVSRLHVFLVSPVYILIRCFCSPYYSFDYFKKGFTAPGSVADFHCIPFLARIDSSFSEKPREPIATAKLMLFLHARKFFYENRTIVNNY